MVEAAIRRMLADGVHPPSVDIPVQALRIAMDTEIALGNLASQNDCASCVTKKFIDSAITMQ